MALQLQPTDSSSGSDSDSHRTPAERSNKSVPENTEKKTCPTSDLLKGSHPDDIDSAKKILNIDVSRQRKYKRKLTFGKNKELITYGEPEKKKRAQKDSGSHGRMEGKDNSTTVNHTSQRTG